MREIDSINKKVDQSRSLIKSNNAYKNNNANKNNKEVSSSFSSHLENAFIKAANEYNIELDFIKAIAKAESNFNPNLVSKSGAKGIMQLMPATAKYLGVTDSFDIQENIMGGSKYIKELLDKYNGDKTLALAAYNAGMNNVAKYDGVPPFKETQTYIKNVFNYLNKSTSKLEAVEISNDNFYTIKAINAYKIQKEKRRLDL